MRSDANLFTLRASSHRVAWALLWILVVGLAVGTATHVENLLRAGLVPRPELPLVYNLFWSSLVVLDPLVAAMLVWRPRVGVAFVLALIAVDLLVNVRTLGISVPVMAQMAYALLTLITIPIVRAATNG